MAGVKSIDMKNSSVSMIKPAELIEIRGAGPLTLADRRLFNVLLNNAWGKEITRPQHLFTVATADLKQEDQTNQRLKRSLRRLQQTLVIAIQSNGDEVVSQLLGSTRIKPSGEMVYSFPVDLAELLKDSSVFAKLDLEVMKSFTSKYAFALYEAISRRINLKHKMTEELDIDDMRELLGVQDGKLANYRNLRIKAIEPAITEVNAITPYQVVILPKTKGRKVVGFSMGWSVKDEENMRQAYQELQRPQIGRKARLEGSTDKIVD